MSQFGGKNAPWNRGAQQLNPQLFGGVNPFTVSQAAALQSLGAGLSVGALGGGVLPAAAVNAAAFASPQAAAFANAVNLSSLNRTAAAFVAQQQQQQQQQNQQQQKSQRAFIGTVTKLQEQYGFIDEDVFFKTDVVRGTMPRVGEKVMVEAAFNPTMPFKWNAFRVQILPNQDGQVNLAHPQVYLHQNRPAHDDRWTGDRREASAYGGGAPSHDRRGGASTPPQQQSTPYGRRAGASPPPRRDRRPSPPPPRRRVVEPATPPVKRERSPLPQRRRTAPSPARSSTSTGRRHDDRSAAAVSPPRQKARRLSPATSMTSGRHISYVPKHRLEVKELDAWDVRKRYSNIYVPSDFFHVKYDWPISVPATPGFSFCHPTSYHVLHKDVDDIAPVPSAIWDPPDANYRFCAKVMLISLPSTQEFFKKVVGMTEDGKLKDEGFEPTSVGRLVQFLVGVRGKSEYMALGGAWSPSLDGVDPQNDPRVLINTAIRTTKALAGLDLSKCSKWLKFLEVRYCRSDKESADADASAAAAPAASAPSDCCSSTVVETVSYFLPDVWNSNPNKLDFEAWRDSLKSQLDSKISALDRPNNSSPDVGDKNIAAKTGDADGKRSPTAVDSAGQSTTAVLPSVVAGQSPEASLVAVAAALPEDEEMTVVDEAGDEELTAKPTHWRNLDIQNMKVVELKTELEIRGLDSKGIKSQLISKLMKAVKEEQEAEGVFKSDSSNFEEAEEAVQGEKFMPQKEAEPIAEQSEKSKNDEHEMKKKKEREERERRERKRDLERHYSLSSLKEPSLLVFPNKTYKNGKFDCKVVSLNSLLDYSHDDNKEHSFEVGLFAEAFYEMILRDGAHNLFKMLLMLNADEEKKIAEKKLQQEKIGDFDKVQEADKIVSKDDSSEHCQAQLIGNEAGETADKETNRRDISKMKSNGANEAKEGKKAENSLRVDPNFLVSLSVFDISRSGYLHEKDVEDILLSAGLYLTRSQAQKLTKSFCSRDTFEYRKLLIDRLGGFVARLESDSAAQGNALLLPMSRTESESKSRGSAQTSIITYQGQIIDVARTLQQLERLDTEKKDLQLSYNALDRNLKTMKEQRDVLEKRKRKLEEDFRDCKKRLYDAEKCLKNSQDDTVQLKTALHRCKTHAEVIVKTVEKVMPPREPSSDKSTKTAPAVKTESPKLKDEDAVHRPDSGKSEVSNENAASKDITMKGEPNKGSAKSELVKEVAMIEPNCKVEIESQDMQQRIEENSATQ